MVDLVITMLVIGIMTAVAAPKFADALHRSRVEAAANRIRVDLGYARQAAISASAAHTVSFTPKTNSYTIPGLTSLDHPGQAYSVELSVAPYDSTIVSVTLGGANDLTFDRFGKPDSGGKITVESGGYQLTVSVDPDTGRATVL